MKIAIHIFTIYMLVLSLLPCGDGGGGIVDLANELFALEHLHTSEHEQHSNACEDDHCPPFCICNCCSIALDYPINLPLHLIPPPPMPDATPFCSSTRLYSSFSSFVWQPP